MRVWVVALALALVACGGRVDEPAAIDSAASDVDVPDDSPVIPADSTTELDTSLPSFDTFAPDTSIPSEPETSVVDGISPCEPPKSFTAVRTFFGEMAFNETKNDGFMADVNVEWKTADLRISSTGRLQGTFTLTYGGPPVTYLERRDALFVDVSASYLYCPVGDYSTVSVAAPTATAASATTDSSATFKVNVAFPVPIATTYMSSMPLYFISVGVTWVRAYRRTDETYFHVLPGRVTMKDPETPLTWDTSVSGRGRLGYYQPIAKSKTVPDFDYRKFFAPW